MEQQANSAAQEAVKEEKFENVGGEQPMENGGNNPLAIVGAVAKGLWAKKWVRDTVKVGGGALVGWIARGITKKTKKED